MGPPRNWMEDWGTIVIITAGSLILWVAIAAPDRGVQLLTSQTLWDNIANAANLFTIIGVVVAALGVWVALAIGLPQLASIREEQRRVADEHARRPRLIIELPDKHPQEPNLEWLHLQVRNVGEGSIASFPLTAREAHVWITVDDQLEQHSLMWSGGEWGKAVPMLNIWVDKPAHVPAVLRSTHASSAVILGSTEIQPNVCYLTEAEFMTQRRASVPLDPGPHRLEVTVQYGTTRIWRDKAWFHLNVTSPEEPLEIEEVTGL